MTSELVQQHGQMIDGTLCVNHLCDDSLAACVVARSLACSQTDKPPDNLVKPSSNARVIE